MSTSSLPRVEAGGAEGGFSPRPGQGNQRLAERRGETRVLRRVGLAIGPENEAEARIAILVGTKFVPHVVVHCPRL